MIPLACISSRSQGRHHAEQGISLVIVMIFLVILSVLGVSAIQTSTLSSRIARNESDRNLAFQAAEAALKDAELDAQNLRTNGTFCSAGATGCRTNLNHLLDDFDTVCTNGKCDAKAITGNAWETASVFSSTGASVQYGAYTGATALPVVAQQPRYLFEGYKLGETTVYRVTAVGFGANTSSQVMLQSALKVDN